ncbi:hypothetical protein [Streptomyces piniterrae]|uniref:hypothetical protein n=1 Tax=Streptomyces piniterrae TaxID=2571125 RepID=UPI001FE4589C|nr:hypothetical protein [Streptomyces piniterrae]
MTSSGASPDGAVVFGPPDASALTWYVSPARNSRSSGVGIPGAEAPRPEASNGSAAITAVAEHRPDVVLMDVRMAWRAWTG